MERAYSTETDNKWEEGSIDYDFYVQLIKSVAYHNKVVVLGSLPMMFKIYKM